MGLKWAHGTETLEDTEGGLKQQLYRELLSENQKEIIDPPLGY